MFQQRVRWFLPEFLQWAVRLEFLGRLLGVIDYHVFKKNPYTWDIAESTKSLDAEG